MDWLSNNPAEIVIRTPTTNGEMMVIHGAGYAPTDHQAKKTQKFSHKGCVAFLAHVVEKEAEEPKPEDIPVIGKYPEVFLEDLPESSPQRLVESRVNLIPGTAPVVNAS